MKKYLLLLPFFTPLAAFATPIITLPNDFISNITGYVGQLFTDLGTYTELIIGVLLGITVIGLVIGFLKR
jgi:cell division protein FtsX